MPNIPLSLYIHFPWCVQKCPYCDFNSYAQISNGLHEEYCEKLILDLKHDAQFCANRKLTSIFLGGGTPSLFASKYIAKIIDAAKNIFGFVENIEITLEANPGTIDYQKCLELKNAGINRISIGIQSFNDAHLKSLGRIHNANEAKQAVEIIKALGISNFNLDLMFGLPQQSIEEAVEDLKTAIALSPTHISWYQLTLEPGTIFAEQNIELPDIDVLWEMQEHGKKILANAGFLQYEVSAYAKDKMQCRHNLNYWMFGDYIGIGAGAHGKITHENKVIARRAKFSDPKKYLESESLIEEEKIIALKDLPFEFMLNALRLYAPISLQLFEERTGLKRDTLFERLNKATNDGFIIVDNDKIETTILGKNFLNKLIEMFLS